MFKYLGKKWGEKFVSPADYQKSYGRNHYYPEDQLQEKGSVLQAFGVLEGRGGVTLDYAYTSVLGGSTESAYIIVYFCGKRDVYQSNTSEILADIKATGANALAFNYSGGGNSTSQKPGSYQDLVDDGKSVIKHLIGLGYKPEHIIAKGHSTGGSVVLTTARQLADEGIKIGGCFADRTFSSFSDVAYSKLCDEGWGIASLLASIVVKTVLSCVEWEVESIEDWKALNAYNIQAAWLNITTEPGKGNDSVIGKGSLHAAIKAYCEENDYDIGCFYGDTFSIPQLIIEEGGGEQGHHLPLSCVERMIQCGDGGVESQTGSEFFADFVELVKHGNMVLPD